MDELGESSVADEESREYVVLTFVLCSCVTSQVVALYLNIFVKNQIFPKKMYTCTLQNSTLTLLNAWAVGKMSTFFSFYFFIQA